MELVATAITILEFWFALVGICFTAIYIYHSGLFCAFGHKRPDLTSMWYCTNTTLIQGKRAYFCARCGVANWKTEL